MVNLEFELDKMDNNSGNIVVYNIMRKGLVVGLMILDREPYGVDGIELNNMECR